MTVSLVTSSYLQILSSLLPLLPFSFLPQSSIPLFMDIVTEHSHCTSVLCVE